MTRIGFSQMFHVNRTAMLRTTALSTVLVLALPASQSWAQVCDFTVVPLPAGCEAPNAGIATVTGIQPNIANVPAVAPSAFGDAGFSISIDDDLFAGAAIPTGDQRTNDLRNYGNAIDVRYDGLDPRRLLNVATVARRNAYAAGETISFKASSNYPAYIARAEILVRDRDRRGAPIVARVPVAPNGRAAFTMPADGSGDLSYALRVYDATGRYDETHAMGLARVDTRAGNSVGQAPFASAGEGDDNTARRGIPTRGGVVTVSGGGTPGGTVTVMGETVPVDRNGKFAVSRVLPAGDRVVTVNVNGRDYVRDIEIPESEWTYVGIIDLLVGAREGGSTDEDWTRYDNGRAAFYAKGTMANGWTITGSADTGNGPIEDMFSRLNDKDPRRVLDRLRTSDANPTLGDDSTFYDDAPTSGAIYLRAENDTTRFTLGDFRTGIAGPGLINNARDLYGAELAYQSASVTENGDARVSAMAYGAQLETAAQRDVLRGTGGSVYFLTRQDITGGSSTVTIQTVDPNTGFVVDNRVLVEGTDYTIDYFQGVIMLSAPLTATSGNGGLVGTGSGQYDVNLVVQYEYTPLGGLTDLNALGGRAEVWATDELRVGASVMVENTPSGDDQRIGSVDLHYRLGETSFAGIEVASTEGPGFARSASNDGGLTIASTGGSNNDAAQAVRFVAELDLQEMGLSQAGNVGLRYESKDAGFSTLSEDITDDQVLWGLDGEIEVTDRVSLSFDTEQFETDAGIEKSETEVSLGFGLSDATTIAVGVQYLDATTPFSAADTGTRTDVGARLTYALRDDLSVYVFGQTTVERTGGLEDDNRIGAGASGVIGEKTTLSAEVSDGDTGLAGKVELAYAASADNEIYLGYTLDPTRSDAGSRLSDDGRIVLGGRYRYSEQLSSYAESIFDMPGSQRSLSQAYGLTYTPNAVWTYGLGLEAGQITDSLDGDFERTAVSFGAAYDNDEGRTGRARIEYRTEDGDGVTRDRDTWGLSAAYATQVAEDWRLLTDVEALYSDSAEDDFRDGEYLRAKLAYAYRPVANERLNVLLSLTYLNDQPGEDQVDANGNTDGPKQRSQVVSIAANYDLNPQLTIGGKLGFRNSEVADRGTYDFEGDSAALLIGSAEYHVVGAWDVFGEGRALYSDGTGTTELGAVAGIYRHINENVKLGLGYEWGSVSDDETDLSYDGQGVFLNLVGKF